MVRFLFIFPTLTRLVSTHGSFSLDCRDSSLWYLPSILARKLTDDHIKARMGGDHLTIQRYAGFELSFHFAPARCAVDY